MLVVFIKFEHFERAQIRNQNAKHLLAGISFLTIFRGRASLQSIMVNGDLLPLTESPIFVHIKLHKDIATMAGYSDLFNTQIFLLSVFRKSDK